MKALVDKDTCIGCTLCVDVCPQIFSMDEDGKAVAADTVVPVDMEAACRNAAQQCPVDAIALL